MHIFAMKKKQNKQIPADFQQIWRKVKLRAQFFMEVFVIAFNDDRAVVG